jgi:wobble nucleotide-excising tRNase
MLREIILKNEASYGNDPETLTLEKVNYIYGANGSGKTTLSRVIANPSGYKDCIVTWKAMPLKVFVYNKDFIQENFSQDLKGVFTLGKLSKDAELLIAGKRTKLDEKILEASTRNGTKEEKLGAAKLFEGTFIDACWDIKKKYEDCFGKAFQGNIRSSIVFRDKCLQELQNNTSELRGFDELKKDAETLFTSGVTKIESINTITQQLIELEKSPILQKTIVGKSDLDISSMITKLNNSDWVNKGRGYLKDNDNNCPFCQQSVEANFKTQLEEYFDEAYTRDLSSINELHQGYILGTSQIIDQLDTILKVENKYIDKIFFEKEREFLKVLFDKNIGLIMAKIKEPSQKVQVESIQSKINQINEVIIGVQDKTKEHNALIENRKNEEKKLIQEIWRFVSDVVTPNFQKYQTNRDPIDKALLSLEEQIKQLDIEIGQLREGIRDLEREIVSTQPTVDQINNILKKFGFENFILATAEEGKRYQIRRLDGRDAKDTLSEGEKTFVTFLYFYHLIKGSQDENALSEERIVVFDDPVSSLDSNVLFIISSLIRGIIVDVRTGQGNIRQMLILTHNTFFHYEVSFDKKEKGHSGKDKTFWIIRKYNQKSKLQKYDFNPIKSSYQLLWDEVRELQGSNSSALCNVLRRILENYFKIAGGLNEEALGSFEGEDKILCRSLISWLHRGSHGINEDLYVEVQAETATRYLTVFKSIFEKSGHLAHYNMMMRIEEDAERQNVASKKEAAR